LQDDSRWYLRENDSDGDWSSQSGEYYIESGTLPTLFPYEEAESSRREWTTVGRKIDSAKTFRQFEEEEKEKLEARRQQQAAALARRKAGRAATPPAGEIPGVPGRLVAKKPVTQANKYSALDQD
jgi:hypothetical protein